MSVPRRTLIDVHGDTRAVFFKITNPAASKVPLPKPLCLANFNRSLVLGSCSMTAFGIPPKCPAAFTWTCFGMV